MDEKYLIIQNGEVADISNKSSILDINGQPIKQNKNSFHITARLKKKPVIPIEHKRQLKRLSSETIISFKRHLGAIEGGIIRLQKDLEEFKQTAIAKKILFGFSKKIWAYKTKGYLYSLISPYQEMESFINHIDKEFMEIYTNDIIEYFDNSAKLISSSSHEAIEAIFVKYDVFFDKQSNYNAKKTYYDSIINYHNNVVSSLQKLYGKMQESFSSDKQESEYFKEKTSNLTSEKTKLINENNKVKREIKAKREKESFFLKEATFLKKKIRELEDQNNQIKNENSTLKSSKKSLLSEEKKLLKERNKLLEENVKLKKDLESKVKTLGQILTGNNVSNSEPELKKLRQQVIELKNENENLDELLAELMGKLKYYEMTSKPEVLSILEKFKNG